MTDGAVTNTALLLIERLPKDVIDPEGKERLTRFTERVGAAFRIDERGRMSADRRALQDLLSEDGLFPPATAKALDAVLSEADEDTLVDERGEARPLDERELERLPDQPTLADLNRFLIDLEPDLAKFLEVTPVPLEDGDGIPADEMPDKIDKFKQCLKDNLGLFALGLVLAAIGVILAVVGVFVPPVEAIAAWVIATFGSVIAAYILGCLVAAGLVSGG